MNASLKVASKIVGAVGLSFAFALTASAATLSVSPSSKSVNVGETFTVNVLLDTSGQPIDGVDVQALTYNPYYLQLQDADSATSGTQISAGNLMPSTLANSADTTQGKIVFSQVTNGGSKYTGSGVLATLTFKALVAGTANLAFNFTPGVTTDSNVASAGADILSSVVNGQYVVGTTGTSPTPTTPGSSPQPTPTPSGSTGFTVGSRVQANANLNVRATASATGVKLGTQSVGALGTILSGPTSADGYIWWNVNYDSGVDGYSAGNFLQTPGVVSTGGTGAQITLRLALGSRLAQVLILQKVLVAEGLLAGSNQTGYFGALTEAAVKAFQAKYGIVSSGTPATTGYGAVGPSTRAKVNSLSR